MIEDDKCVHGNKVIEITYDDIHLGEEDARCPYYNIIPDFDPTQLLVIQTVCKGFCKVTRQNLAVEKLAFERAKIAARAQARFNIAAAKKKQEEDNRLVDNS